MEQRVCTASRASLKPGCAAIFFSVVLRTLAAVFCGGSATTESLGIADSQMIAQKISAATAQVQYGFPVRECMLLNQCRMTTPIRKTSEAISQLNFDENASG